MDTDHSVCWVKSIYTRVRLISAHMRMPRGSDIATPSRGDDSTHPLYTPYSQHRTTESEIGNLHFFFRALPRPAPSEPPLNLYA